MTEERLRNLEKQLQSIQMELQQYLYLPNASKIDKEIAHRTQAEAEAWIATARCNLFRLANIYKENQ